jgi:hypothetical protein
MENIILFKTTKNIEKFTTMKKYVVVPTPISALGECVECKFEIVRCIRGHHARVLMGAGDAGGCEL